MSGTVNYSVDDLALSLSMSPRTIYRYIDTFKNAGFIVEKDNNGYFKLATHSRGLENFDDLLHFSDDEACILSQLLDSLDDNNALKRGLRQKLETFFDKTSRVRTFANNRNAENLNNIRKAINLHRQILIHNYASAHSATVRDRLVEPFSLSDNYVQVSCFDVESASVKIFKLQRMGQVQVLNSTWQFAHLHKESFVDIFRVSGAPNAPLQQIDLRLDLRARNLLLEEYPQSQNQISPAPNDPSHFLLSTKVVSYAGVARFVLGLHDSIQVLGNENFKSFLRQTLKNITF